MFAFFIAYLRALTACDSPAKDARTPTLTCDKPAGQWGVLVYYRDNSECFLSTYFDGEREARQAARRYDDSICEGDEQLAAIWALVPEAL